MMIGFTGLRYVGKSTAADILVKHGFTKAHAFGPGKAMCITYYEYLGIDHDTAVRMVHGDLKDTPCDKLPGGVSSRYFMEPFGKFMGVAMGADWTLAVELDKMRRDGIDRVTIESLVYEAPIFRERGGVIVRLLRDGAKPTGDHTDVAQAEIREDFVIDNNGSVDQLENALMSLVRTLEAAAQGHEVEWFAPAGLTRGVIHKDRVTGIMPVGDHDQ